MMNPSPTFAGSHAFRLALVLLGGIACIAAFSAVSRSKVSGLEQFEEITAFGDTHYFTAPTEATESHPPLPAANLHGAPLFIAGGEKLERRDTRMLRIGHDEATGLQIYTPRDPLEGEKTKDKSVFFLKSGPDEYIKLRPGKG